jgi:ceramide glucosyltransferase
MRSGIMTNVTLVSVTLVSVAVVLTSVSFALYIPMMALFWRALIRRRPSKLPTLERCPRVSVLKPLAGCDEDLQANLDSFGRLDYPDFEILLGVADPSDRAFAMARRFVASHPRCEARIVLTDPGAAINPKVAQLIGLERLSTGEVYVISDSNVRVDPGYLWSLVSELADPSVGIVTSLFSGTGEMSIGAALENLQICASTAPGIASADAVSRPLTVGKSMALRRRDLANIGGFAAIGHVLAEDHLLGRRFMQAGFRARTSLHTVENRNIGCSVARTLERHTRWAKMRRSLFPLGFALEQLLSPIVIATLGALLAPGRVTAGLVTLACVAQTVCALLAVRLLRGNWLAWWYAPLEIVRNYIAFGCWLCAWASRRISWRGHPFVLRRGSVIVPVATGSDRESVSNPSENPPGLAA